MLLKNRYTILPAALIFISALSACNKRWDDHGRVTDSNLKNNLYQAIKLTANLGRFSDMLVKTGYDKIISTSKTYTVWAPTDQALQSLDPAIVNDTARLKLFVGNHISYQSYVEGAGAAAQRIQMLNGKYNNVAGTSFDSASIVTANLYASNGVFHVIDRFIPRYDNCWEFLKNTTATPLMKTLLLSLNYTSFDSTKATQTGVDPNTGRPIWDSTNGKIPRNHFLDTAYDVSDEAGQYTFLLLADAGYTTELNKITPYFKTGTTDSTNTLAGLHLVKDFAFKGLYSPAQLPSVLVSRMGVTVPINQANILASYKTSNGIVYIMSDITFQFADKFPPVLVQGTSPLNFASDRSSLTFYRVRKDTSTGRLFNDIFIQNYNYGSYWVRYQAKNLYSTKYNVSWVALNDIYPPNPTVVPPYVPWQQRLAMDSVTNTASLPYVSVGYNVYSEVALGQWTLGNFRNAYLYLVGPAAASGGAGIDCLSLNYIKLTPLP